MRKALASILLFLLFFTMASFADDKTTVWIDTDLAQDDWLALTYLVQQPEIDIKAITIAGDGVNDCGHGLVQLKYFLKMMHRMDIPFACGAEKPLQGNNQFPPLWRHQAFNFYNVKNLSPVRAVKNSAAKLINQILLAAQPPVTLIELAPMTNAAEFYLQQPELFKQKVRVIYFTGGAFDRYTDVGKLLPNTQNFVASWNAFIDPEALNVILTQAKPAFFAFIPENVTRPLDSTLLEISHIIGTQTHKSNKLDFVQQMLKSEKKDLYIADEVTALAALHPKLCKWAGDRVVVLTQPSIRAGQTLFSCRGAASVRCKRLPPNIFVTHFWEGLTQVAESSHK